MSLTQVFRSQGVSDTPAWVVAQANQYARDHGKTQFCVYQGSWNVIDRAFEREIIPMAREHGMALAPWNVLAAGKLRSDAEEARREKSGENGRDLNINGDKGWKRTEQEKKMSNALDKVAKEVGVESVTAGNYVLTTSFHPIARLLLDAFSCHCIRDAQNSIRLPYHWWTES
jgi:aryl-alcohol dehydrogenase-like predicted oxidoreductase